MIVYHEDHSRIAAIDQDGVIYRYSSLHIRPFLGQTSVLDHAITDRDIEDQHKERTEDRDEPAQNEEHVQYNAYLQS